MEKLPGHQLPTLEQESFEPDPNDLVLARKVHQQLTDIILQLGMWILPLQKDNNNLTCNI